VTTITKYNSFDSA